MNLPSDRLPDVEDRTSDSDCGSWLQIIRETLLDLAFESDDSVPWCVAATDVMPDYENHEREECAKRVTAGILGDRPIPPIKQVVVVDESPVSVTNDEGIAEALAAYFPARHPNGAVIELYANPIRAAVTDAIQLVPLIRVVLRHEIGHHVMPASSEELKTYNSNSDNEATQRVETAAQLFAWATSDSEHRAVVEALSRKQPPAYHHYGRMLAFAARPFKVSEKMPPVRLGADFLLQLYRTPDMVAWPRMDAILPTAGIQVAAVVNTRRPAGKWRSTAIHSLKR